MPKLAGATLRDRLLASLGAWVGLCVTGVLCALAFGAHIPMLVAPLGASAVLLFAVPTSPLAQPWPIIGGSMLSTVVGLLVHAVVLDPALAAGLAVGLAIVVMSLTRSLHPPGGAMALSTAMSGPGIVKWSVLFPLAPVGISCCILVASGWLFHRLRKHSYPHVPLVKPETQATPVRQPVAMTGFLPEDVDAALAKFNETFDIDREDLEGLLREIELQAEARTNALRENAARGERRRA
jgi:CBS domain-containing membrane protein